MGNAKVCPHCGEHYVDHGTRTRYVYGCRCAECTEEERKYQAKRMKAKKQAGIETKQAKGGEK